MIRTIYLTEFQQGELNHKLCIMRDEQDLLDSYEVTKAEVEALIIALPVGAGTFTFDLKYAEMLEGEIENAIDILESNMDRIGDDEMGQQRGLISSLRGLIRKMK